MTVDGGLSPSGKQEGAEPVPRLYGGIDTPLQPTLADLRADLRDKRQF